MRHIRKETMGKISMRVIFLPVCVICLGVLLLSGGCASTKQASGITTSSFLGDDVKKLKPGAENQLALRYVNPSAHWVKYNKILLEPVTFWGGDTTAVPTKDQQVIVNYFYTSLKEQFSQYFTIVTEPGPGVMRMQVAVTDVQTATPLLRTISVIVPQAHAVSTLKALATGSYPFVGKVQAEGKVTDSETGELLGAAVDKRIGTDAIQAGFQWKLGDAEHVIDTWVERLVAKLVSWTSGKETPS